MPHTLTRSDSIARCVDAEYRRRSEPAGILAALIDLIGQASAA